jgi:ferrous iron transport protein B
MSSCDGCGSGPGAVAALPVRASEGSRVVAVVGPPNSGKTTLYNRLTGLHQKVANFPGVTVEHHLGRVKLADHREISLVDLPGIYSLEARSEDEEITRDVLQGTCKGVPRPDAVLLVLDATNLGRHLMLAAPVLALGLPTLIVLNLADELEHRRGAVDPKGLESEMGCSVALVSARTGQGFDRIVSFLAGQAAPLAPRRVELPVLSDIPKCRQWAAGLSQGAGYRAPAPPEWTARLDAVFLHPLAGPLIFALVVVAVFQSIFSFAVPLMDGIDALVTLSGNAVANHLPDSILRSLLIEGVWGGVGSVIIFLPQILLLFLFIGILEDSGYLARAAVIADRTMARVGLQGKAFIPLLSAYACAVPAILAVRTIEDRRDRLATIFIAPFMTCSARLPVYTLVIAAFVPERQLLGPFLGARAAAMLGLYVLGFVGAVVTARLLKSSVLKSGRASFILEMPAYRWPTLRSLGLRLLDRARIFLRRAGTVILAVALVLWALAHLPLQNGAAPPIEQSLAGTLGRAIEPAIEPLGFNWKIGIGLIASLAAREVIVGTLGTIYGIEDEAEPRSLQQALRQDLTPAGAAALVVFFAFAMQCMSTVAVVRRETGGWKWPAAQFLYMGVLAYVGAWVTFRVLS